MKATNKKVTLKQMPKNNNDINIRLIKKNDVEGYFQLIDNNRNRLIRYFPVTVREISDMDACAIYFTKKLKQIKKSKLYIFVIEEKEKMIGVLIVKNVDWRVPKAELAYFIDREHEGKRVMTKAMDLLLDHCFRELGMNKLYICASINNEPSRRLAIKRGFHLEGIHRQDFRIETGELEDVEHYSLLKKEWSGNLSLNKNEN